MYYIMGLLQIYDFLILPTYIYILKANGKTKLKKECVFIPYEHFESIPIKIKINVFTFAYIFLSLKSLNLREYKKH